MLNSIKISVVVVLVAMLALAGACSDDGDGIGTVDSDTDTDSDTDGDTDTDSDADFSGIQFPSPMPPGGLDPQDTPQIIVFGFDDCMFTGDHPNDTTQAMDNGMNFLAQLLGPLTNPDGTDAHMSFYVNGAYLPNSEVGGTWGSETEYTVAACQEFLSLGFELGNHTFDHLEINGTWDQIPEDWHDGSLGGWTDHCGTMMPKEVWLDPILSFNDTLLKSTFGVSQLYGFRAPRLEINDEGLQAVKEFGYIYDVNLEEGHQWEYISAAVQSGMDSSGFKWTVWPYTLDNGSPGAWQSQDFGEKEYLKNLPTGLWEVPVYMLYIPDNGLQEIIATRMKNEITSEDISWIGDQVREITSFDFNTFVYSRLTREEWVEVMKYNFLLRYNGNRAPLTFGGHPAQYSWRYDNEVILGQPANADFVDVLNYTTYQDRKDAISEFMQWISDNYADDVYFMSSLELVEYMLNPFDLNGDDAPGDQLASPSCAEPFTVMSEWEVEKDALGSDAAFTIDDADTMTIDFTVGVNDEGGGDYCWVDVATFFAKGFLEGVSHIDITYETEAPFRIRLNPSTDEISEMSMQVLLAGVGGERKARIRIGDFRPDPYADPDDIASHGFVDDEYMGKIGGISFENASTVDQTSYTVQIKRIVFHGLSE
jgi:peptidoglycan/xylan/chitin deacetylase (PgdA/CDA1 family)